MQHEVTNGRDPVCNIELPMVGTLQYMLHGTLYITERDLPYWAVLMSTAFYP